MLDEFALNLRKVFDESRGQEETLRPTNQVFSTSICHLLHCINSKTKEKQKRKQLHKHGLAQVESTSDR